MKLDSPFCWQVGCGQAAASEAKCCSSYGLHVAVDPSSSLSNSSLWVLVSTPAGALHVAAGHCLPRHGHHSVAASWQGRVGRLLGSRVTGTQSHSFINRKTTPRVLVQRPARRQGSDFNVAATQLCFSPLTETKEAGSVGPQLRLEKLVLETSAGPFLLSHRERRGPGLLRLPPGRRRPPGHPLSCPFRPAGVPAGKGTGTRGKPADAGG